MLIMENSQKKNLFDVENKAMLLEENHFWSNCRPFGNKRYETNILGNVDFL